MFVMPQSQDVAGGTIASVLQARPDSTDYAILTASHDLTGVSGTSCGVTAQGSPNMTVAVASGTVYVAGVTVAVTSGNVTIATASGSQPRRDIVVVNSSGVKSAVAGAAAPNPVKPSIPASSVVLAEVFVPALDTTIGTLQIVDKRVAVRLPTVAGLPTLTWKTADESVTSSVALQDDNDLLVAVGANETWAVKFVLMVSGPAAADILLNFSTPSGSWRATAFGLSSADAATVTVRESVTNNFDIILGIGTDPRIYVIEAVVANGGTAGNFRLRWAQAVSNATPTKILANSYVTSTKR